MAKKYTKEDVIKKSIEVNGDVIDFSKFNYVNSQTKATCICKKCGNVFEIMPYSLLAGHICRKCFDRRLSETKTQSLEQVNKRILDSGVNVRVVDGYINTKQKALAECLTCGYKWMADVNSLVNGHGCPKCANKRFKNNKEFQDFCCKKFPEFDFSITTYDSSEEKVKVICKKHGMIEVSKRRLIYGSSENLCKKCEEDEKRAMIEAKKREREFNKLQKKIKLEQKKIEKEYNKIKKERQRNDKKAENFPNIHTTEEFVNILKQQFEGCDYDFSNTAFNGWDKQTCYTCLTHNFVVTDIASRIFKGKKCCYCNGYNKAFTTEEWVSQAEELYPEIDYSEAIYVNKNTKIRLRCQKHGRFDVIPRKFITGESYCPDCMKEKRKETAFNENKKNFLKRMGENYKGRDYDISRVEFKGVLERVEITCKKHNITFRPLAFNIMYTNSRCPECIKEESKSSNRKTLDDTRRLIEERFNGKIELCEDNEEPENVDTKLKLLCHEKFEDGREHGIFYKTGHELTRGNGCPVCGKKEGGFKKRMTQEEFIRRVNDVHIGKEYDLSETIYKGYEEPVRVFCNKSDKHGHVHGEFWIRAGSLLKGEGCSKCNASHLEQDIRHELIIHNYNFLEQKKFDWLGRQSLDFFLPDCNIGIECQGFQHFYPEYYVLHDKEKAEKRFTRRIELDKLKKRLCKEHNIKIIYYLSKEYLKHMQNDDIVICDREELDDLLKCLSNTKS